MAKVLVGRLWVNELKRFILLYPTPCVALLLHVLQIGKRDMWQ